ncbi:MAG: hypothetical protein ACREDT_08140 [Methylocella sp.]
MNALNFRFVPRDIDARISRVDLICAGWGSNKIAQSDMNRDVRWRPSDGNSRFLPQCSSYQIFMSGKLGKITLHPFKNNARWFRRRRSLISGTDKVVIFALADFADAAGLYHEVLEPFRERAMFEYVPIGALIGFSS